MKRVFILAITIATLNITQSFALDTVFDSMDKATEVKLTPNVKTSQTQVASQAKATSTSTSSSTSKPLSIKEQKFNSALINLDDAQVELRQELSVTTTKYNEAVIEKNKAVANCKAIKKEMKSINKKMKNIEKSKKMINKSLEATT